MNDSIADLAANAKTRINFSEALKKWQKEVEDFQTEIELHTTFKPREKESLKNRLLAQKELFWNIKSYFNNL
jgi:hypothetical protein